MNLPESYATSLKTGVPVKLEIPGAPENQRWQTAQSITVLPTADPASHTIQVRIALPGKLGKFAPGAFAKAYLPTVGQRGGALSVPAKAVIKRTELYAVYVADTNGKFHLRQIRPGRTEGDRIEVLAGLQPGERVALDPLAASRQ